MLVGKSSNTIVTRSLFLAVTCHWCCTILMLVLCWSILQASGSQEEASSPPLGEGLLLIGDIGFEHHADAAHFLESPEPDLNCVIGFQNVAAIGGPLKRQP